MAFTSFEPFLYARNDLRFVVLDEVSAKKSGKYYIYELCAKNLGENSAQNLPTKNERNSAQNLPLKMSENSQNFTQNERISSENSLKQNSENLDINSQKSKANLDKNSRRNSQISNENSQILPQNEQISQKNSHSNPQNSEVKKEKFTYTALNNELFAQNDEIVITILGHKIILFRNFTRLTDNFKEAKLRHTIFSLLFFCASAVFGTFCVKNGFLVVDMAFFMLFLLGFIISLINYALLKRQIAILSTLEKQDFIDYASS